jgi:hypothetical protein
MAESGDDSTMNPDPKHKIWRSERYKKFVRSQPCVVCVDDATEVHHLKTRGSGGGDAYGIPVCRLHHVVGENHPTHYREKFSFYALAIMEKYLLEHEIE